MNIPKVRRKSTIESDPAEQSSSFTNSVVEGITAGYRRAAQYEPVDTRSRYSASDQFSISPTDRVLTHRSFSAAIDEEGPAPIENTLMPNEATTLLPKTVENETNEGKSTLAQTIFNITNLLIGIGLLSLPLGIHEAGWVLGISLVVSGAVVTAYTAVLLARVLETEADAYAYSDLARLSYGKYMTWITAIIFVLELSAAASALMILFGDNFHAVIPAISSNTFKFICFLIMLPATLLPLRILSYASILGIISTVILVTVIFFDGIAKVEAPGSLRDPMPTDVLPAEWTTFPLAIGLLVSSFGGHGIMPQVYKDMADRKDFPRAICIAYLFSTILCCFVGVIGYLMFGRNIQSEVTINLLETPGYSKILNTLAVAMTGITSLTKIPLAIKSISANFDVFLGLKTMKEERRHGIGRVSAYLTVRLVVNLAAFLLAILFPSFDRVMAVLGSAFVFLISIILPTLFYVRTMTQAKKPSFSTKNAYILWALIVLSSITAIIATAWAFLPQH